MKFVILLCVLSALLLQIEASPVQLLSRSERAVARQQAVNNDVAPAAAPASDDDDEDDDEDDDDDEPDLGDLIDDDDVLLISGLSDDDEEEDDDDEEEDDTPQGQAAPAATASDDDEEDDDDDDYLDRLFDDILGDDDDEDDDDEVAPAASAQQSSVAASPAQALEEVAPAASSVSSGISDGVDLPAESGNAVEAAASGNAAEDISAAAAAAPATAASGSSSNNEGIAGDDDEEADDDEDDDDDDIIGDDIIEARREARDLKNNVIDMSTDAFQARHNHFIDAIFSRINRIVSDNYDPFVVRLAGRSAPTTAGSATTVKATNKNKANKAGGHKKLKNTRSEPRASGSVRGSGNNQAKEEDAGKLQEQLMQLQSELAIKAIEKKPVASDQATASAAPASATATATATATDSDSPKAEVRTVSGGKSGQKKSTSTNAAGGSTQSHKHSTNKKASGTTAVKSGNYNQPAGASKAGDVEKLQKAEGSLSGLASLKRVGNVKVISDAEGRNSTIKAKFTLGPLILRVEKSFKRGSVRSVKSATARTNEMIGRIKFSVVDDRATLMSIKVQQPKQVEVESKDNHDRTREFVWRRTPKIAKLVNEKLKLAAESLFAPQGVEVVRL
ncbi:dentin sialophosphoprotein isoform X1 [Drosophila pseudoobscura]|uniref:Dentin sialophosphoprotein isoform X1 n=1 Tax=Drosophila pseudoobscura pseudoobscura TaxID=46245 RepID=A0A6I8W2C3_DROPS|nr:dentin sialophosphoprotein isoform X1 [Drosophila pseudoobscura]XP_033237514.1 dentin sialophosphoprotein isoform X1 [Drosophila pseudoobscura]XP_033237515.1 dentin sialophosphoprotein isoform X1 [Drosophila pseudoobscura]XP_033237516.1 dentin sialophosphoprotein isoform X1 [Drosophila pseudoobscura]